VILAEGAIPRFTSSYRISSLIAWLEDLKRQAETTNASVIFVERKKGISDASRLVATRESVQQIC
jgi:hypothetical protein